MKGLVERLNDRDVGARLAALEELAREGALGPERGGGHRAVERGGGHGSAELGGGQHAVEYVNNHIHTTYSFSPYSPTKAIYMAKSAGLLTAGIMDHDSVAGAEEFARAGEIAGIATTAGLECRCSMVGTPFEGARLNNPDQKSVAYLALHGIPRRMLGRVQEFMAPYRAERAARSRKMTERLGEMFAPHGISLDYGADVEPLSLAPRGGTVTERHILFALARKLIARFGAGPALTAFLTDAAKAEVSGGAYDKLSSPDTPFYEYHLLGFLKANFAARFYIDAAAELPGVSDFLRLAVETGAIPVYPYLGDVKNSVTGDKKDDAFEDAYLDELTAWLPEYGFRALTYMPARNTPEQLARVADLCVRNNLFQISGEDINSPFQSFVCRALEDPRHSRLITATWALIGHERAADEDPELGMFSPRSIARTPSLDERAALFAELGRRHRSNISIE